MKTTLQIAGSLYATCTDTQINFTFMPSASDAGYFGSPFFIVETDIDPAPDDTDDEPSPDYERLEKLLWKLVAQKLTIDPTGKQAHFVCGWEE